jgi:hypothetical protein
MGRYRLPDLPYDYAALEPAIAGHVLELHHATHHRLIEVMDQPPSPRPRDCRGLTGVPRLRRATLAHIDLLAPSTSS